MSRITNALVRFDGVCAAAIDSLASRRWAASLFLFALTLSAYSPGVVLLPAVDRTEIVYASASRQMLAEGNFTDPRFRGDQLRGKPIGAFWLQMAASAMGGEAAKGQIAAYRLPSLAGVIVAVLATFWLLAPAMGARAALIAAALFAATPILAVLANLAVADGIALGAAAVAQLALLRVYCAGGAEPNAATPSPRPLPVVKDDGEREKAATGLRALRKWLSPFSRKETEDTNGLALLFWAAQGIGVLINALAVPLLALSTVAVLLVFDRRPGWLRRLNPIAGLPVLLVLGAPWLIARAIADGGAPFHGMSWDELLAALGGSQADKWKAAPGSFTLAFALGFLPGALLLAHAFWRLWLERAEPLARFLFAWLTGYLLYLELLSGKPALYAVPPLFPAAAAAVVLAMTLGQPQTQPLVMPQRLFAPPWWAPAAVILAVYGALLWLMSASPAPAILAGCLLVAALLALGAETARLKLASAWVASSVCGFAFFLAFTFGAFLPHLEQAWPAERIAEAAAPLEACATGPAGVIGFREPSATFVANATLAEPAQVAAWAKSGERRVALVEGRWRADLARAFLHAGAPEPAPAGCVAAFNTMRGCALSFSIYVTGAKEKDDPACRAAPKYACGAAGLPASETPKDTARCR